MLSPKHAVRVIHGAWGVAEIARSIAIATRTPTLPQHGTYVLPVAIALVRCGGRSSHASHLSVHASEALTFAYMPMSSATSHARHMWSLICLRGLPAATTSGGCRRTGRSKPPRPLCGPPGNKDVVRRRAPARAGT